MKLQKQIELLEKKLEKKQIKINELVANSRIRWRKYFFVLLLSSIIIILILL